jgi:hypothetical protein
LLDFLDMHFTVAVLFEHALSSSSCRLNLHRLGFKGRERGHRSECHTDRGAIFERRYSLKTCGKSRRSV